jgi:hypothetical protein
MMTNSYFGDEPPLPNKRKYDSHRTLYRDTANFYLRNGDIAHFSGRKVMNLTFKIAK